MKYDQPEHFNAVAYKNDGKNAQQHVFPDQSIVFEPEYKAE